MFNLLLSKRRRFVGSHWTNIIIKLSAIEACLFRYAMHLSPNRYDWIGPETRGTSDRRSASSSPLYKWSASNQIDELSYRLYFANGDRSACVCFVRQKMGMATWIWKMRRPVMMKNLHGTLLSMSAKRCRLIGTSWPGTSPTINKYNGCLARRSIDLDDFNGPRPK